MVEYLDFLLAERMWLYDSPVSLVNQSEVTFV